MVASDDSMELLLLGSFLLPLLLCLLPLPDVASDNNSYISTLSGESGVCSIDSGGCWACSGGYRGRKVGLDLWVSC